MAAWRFDVIPFAHARVGRRHTLDGDPDVIPDVIPLISSLTSYPDVIPKRRRVPQDRTPENMPNVIPNVIPHKLAKKRLHVIPESMRAWQPEPKRHTANMALARTLSRPWPRPVLALARTLSRPWPGPVSALARTGPGPGPDPVLALAPCDP